MPPARTPHEKHFVWGRGSSHQNIRTSTVVSLEYEYVCEIRIHFHNLYHTWYLSAVAAYTAEYSVFVNTTWIWLSSPRTRPPRPTSRRAASPYAPTGGEVGHRLGQLRRRGRRARSGRLERGRRAASLRGARERGPQTGRGAAGARYRGEGEADRIHTIHGSVGG